MKSPRGLDLELLQPWLAERIPERITAPIQASILAGGRSNLTYRLESGTAPLVLRRPPLGHVQATAHDMSREFRMISALAGSGVPVPNTVLLEHDANAAAGIGAPFYLMDFVEGQVMHDPAQNAAFGSDQLRALSLELVAVLARLHETEPASVGLADFGRPEGYLGRQMARWATQLSGSRSRSLPSLDRLETELKQRLPTTAYSSLLHGDFRLDNAIVRTDAGGVPHIAAVLDWEMSTIGDSLADLGMFGLYWDIAATPGATSAAPSSVDQKAGYPSFDELVDFYAAERGITVPDLSWYVAFSAAKLAIILEGIHLRFTQGGTVGEGFDRIGQLVEPLAETGLRSLDLAKGE